METLQKALQQFISIVYALSILSHDPDHGSTCLWLIQGVQVFAQSGDHTLVPEWRQCPSLHIKFHILLLFPLFSSLTLITSSEIILCHSLQMSTFLTLMRLTYLGIFGRCP